MIPQSDTELFILAEDFIQSGTAPLKQENENILLLIELDIAEIFSICIYPVADTVYCKYSIQYTVMYLICYT